MTSTYAPGGVLDRVELRRSDPESRAWDSTAAERVAFKVWAVERYGLEVWRSYTATVPPRHRRPNVPAVIELDRHAPRHRANVDRSTAHAGGVR